MIVDPARVKFANREDVVHYVSGGFLPPLKDDFEKVMNKVRNPDPDDEVTEKKKGKEVVILNNIIPEENDREMIEAVLTKVYEDRVRNRNRALMIIGGVAVAAFGVALFNRAEERKEEKAIEKMIDRMRTSDDVIVTEF